MLTSSVFVVFAFCVTLTSAASEAWWFEIYDRFNSEVVRLRRCNGRVNIQPAEGSSCNPLELTCFFGNQWCEGRDYPEARCTCSGDPAREWSCVPEPCPPAAVTPGPTPPPTPPPTKVPTRAPTNKPTAKPTVGSTAVPGCKSATVSLTLDSLKDGTSWEFLQVDSITGEEIALLDQAARGDYTDNNAGDLIEIDLGCLDTDNVCYEFFLAILFGESGPIWNIEFDNQILTSSEGFFFGGKEPISFGNCVEPSCPNRSQLTIATDSRPEQTFWVLYDLGGSLPTSVYDVGPGRYQGQSNRNVQIDLGCLDTSKCWMLEMRDSFGNGGPNWQVNFNGNQVISSPSGGSFGNVEEVTFGDGCAAFFGPSSTSLVGACTPQQDRFNLCVSVQPTTPVALSSLYAGAAARWSEIIVGDRGIDIQLPAQTTRGFLTTNNFNNLCGFNTGIPGTVDDIFICATYGPSSSQFTLGSAFSLTVVDGTDAVVVGGFFNIASLGLAEFPLLDFIITHEMGHILGIGTNWDATDLVPSRNTATCDDYQGPNAIREFQKISGCFGLKGVPSVEDDFGSGGSDCVHWDERCFISELMTPSAGNVPFLPISKVTVGTLDDLGYTVDYSAADTFTKSMLHPDCRCDNILHRKLRGNEPASSGEARGEPSSWRSAVGLSEERRLDSDDYATAQIESISSKLAALDDLPDEMLNRMEISMNVYVHDGSGGIAERAFTTPVLYRR